MGDIFNIVTCYFNEEGLLKKQEKLWEGLPNRIIVIDDHSTEEVKTKHEAYRIDDDIAWNQPGARNLGLTVADDGWVLLFDIDHYFKPEDIQKLIDMPKKQGYVYFFKRYTFGGIEQNTTYSNMLIEKKTYWDINGFNEDFSGHYGYDDVHFKTKIDAFRIPTDFATVPIYIEDIEEDRERPNDRNPSHNSGVGNTLQKTPCLRFKWHKI
jgi:glycosyltransferase involved in cell wall biosynthesis